MATSSSATPTLRLEDLVIPAKDREHRSIPGAKFIEKVETFVGTCDPAHVESLFKELLQKYRFMERSLLHQKDTLRAKTVAIRETMDAIKLLQKQRDKAKEGDSEDLRTHFQLAETLHVEATVPPTDTVCLWLAADVVMEYTLEEAEEVLSKSLKYANKYLEEAETDMEWLRTQITMTEVNVARVHNFAVLKREQARAVSTSEGLRKAKIVVLFVGLPLQLPVQSRKSRQRRPRAFKKNRRSPQHGIQRADTG